MLKNIYIKQQVEGYRHGSDENAFDPISVYYRMKRAVVAPDQII